MTDKLIKIKQSFKQPKTVVLIGNGAVKDGFEPLRELLDTLPYNIGTDHPARRKAFFSNPDMACVLAHNAQLLKMFGYQVMRNYYVKEQLEKFLPIVTECWAFRKLLADQYLNAPSHKVKPITLRSYPDEIEDIIGASTTAVITVNWDELLESNGEIQALIKLHGTCSDHNTMILPSELTSDSHLSDTLGNLVKHLPEDVGAMLKKSIEISSRPESVRKGLRKVHDLALDWLMNAEEIFVWGIAFHPYDAELLSIVTHSFAPHTKRTKVAFINKSQDDINRGAAVFQAIQGERIDCLVR